MPGKRGHDDRIRDDERHGAMTMIRGHQKNNSRVHREIAFVAFAVLLFLPPVVFATGEQADLNAAGSGGGCNPGNEYDPSIPDTQRDQQGKQGLLGLYCYDPTSGQPGKCVAADKCMATGEKGTPTSQQMSNANDGNTANGAPPKSAAGTGGSSPFPQITPNQEVVLPTGSLPQNSGTPAQGNSETLQPGSSIFQSAYPFATGQNNFLPQYQGGEPNGPAAAPSADQQSWLAGAQQYQLQSAVPAPPLEAAPAAAPSGDAAPTAAPGFAPATPGPSASDAAYANTLVTMSPQQQTMQAAQTVEQGIANTAGSWAESALKYFDQSTLGGQTNSTPPASGESVQATIYYPGCVGGPAGCDTSMEGGLYGSRGNYLNPNVPTVAAGYDSGYSYGQVLSISNPSTGQSTNAVVGDVCPGCGSGVDLNPAAANAVGLTQDQGRGGMQVAVVASTAGYADGAQLASALNGPPDPWAGSSANLAGANNPGLPGVATVSDYANYALASTQYTNEQIAAQSAVSAQEAVAFDSNAGRPTGALSSGNTGEAISATDITTVEPNPVGAVVQGPELSPPNPVGTVTSEPLALSPQQVESKIPTPQMVETSPQTQVEAANQIDNQNAQDQALAARLAQADAQTNAFNNPVLPKVDTNTQSGETVTQQVYDSAISGAGNNVPVPEPAQANLPTQAQMQADLLKQGQDFSALNANSFYQAVEGSQFAAAGPAVPVGTVEPGQALPQPAAAQNTDTSQPIENPPIPQARPSVPSNTSIVDYLATAGQDASFGARADLAVALGLVQNASQYVGSAVQNMALLKACWNGLCF